jgi:transcriptional regulator with XRE-family HTH domain
MTSAPSSERSRAVQLGAELRTLRDRAGMTLVQVAQLLGRDHTTVSRWERALTKPGEADTAAMLAVLGVTGDTRDRLIELARHDGVNDWVAPGIGRQLAMLIEYERTAAAITEVNSLLIPGLLQTREYSMSIMLSNGLSRGQAEQSTLVRLERQGELTRVKPPRYLALVGEQALRYPACAREAMVEQLKYLQHMSECLNIGVRVLPLKPFEYTFAHEGRFILLEFARDTPIVQVEGFRFTSTVTNPKAAENYRVAVDSLAQSALNELDSMRLIRDLTTEMEGAA